MKYIDIIEKYIFQIFIFCLPFQIRYIFASWNPPEPLSILKISHEFNEWTAGFIYGSDILFIILIFLWLSRTHYTKLQNNHSRQLLVVFSILLLVVSGLSFFQADNIYLATFRYFKLAEGLILFFYARDFISRYDYYHIVLPIALSSIFQGAMATIQSLTQHSLGLWFLGEGYFYPGLKSVASFRVGEELFLRAYGTFQHPNVLAFFGLCNLILIYKYLLIENSKNKLILGISIFLIHWTILLTFSRSIILILMALHGFLFLKYIYAKDGMIKKIILMFMISTIIFSLLYWPQLKSRLHIDVNEEAYQDRVAFSADVTASAIKNKHIGIGIGHGVYDVIKRMPYENAYRYQPAHNIFLLIYWELGIIGLLVFTGFIGSLALENWRTQLKKMRFLFIFKIVSMAFVLSLGMVDHYQWTLHQGSMIFWLFLALV